MDFWTRAGLTVEALIGPYRTRYGPAHATEILPNGDCVIGENWSGRRRRPDRAAVESLGLDPDDLSTWPNPVATCASFATLAAEIAYGVPIPRGGRSISQALRRAPLRGLTDECHPKRWRAYDFDSLPEDLAPVNFVLYRGHVVLLVDCDRVQVRTADAPPLGCADYTLHSGMWVLGADGRYGDQARTPSGRVTLATRALKSAGWPWWRAYSCQLATWEPVAERAERQRGWSDRYRRFRVVRWLAPASYPNAAPHIIVRERWES